MMEFIAGLGIGLWAGTFVSAAGMFMLRARGYTFAKSAQMTEREIDRVNGRMDAMAEEIEVAESKADTKAGETDRRLAELEDGLRTSNIRQSKESDRIDRIVELMEFSKEEA